MFHLKKDVVFINRVILLLAAKAEKSEQPH